MTRVSRDRHHAFSLVEAVISIAVVGLLLVAALNTLGSSHAGRAAIDRERIGLRLGESLLEEALSAERVAPTSASAGLTRSTFESVLDYAGWRSTPAVNRSGTVIAGFDDWTREVAVDWVNPGDSSVVVGTPSGVVRIRVTVLWRDRVVAETVGLRSVPGGIGLRTGTAFGAGPASGPAGGG